MSKEALKEAFVFTYDRMRRFQGEWHLERQLMFPAHVFLDSDDEAALTEELRCCAVMDVLSKEKGAILYVRKNEERFLTSLCGENHHLGMSKGVIKNGLTYVTEGPLWGLEERICQIDRHKRLARLKVPGIFGAGRILAGLEIVDKC